MAEPDRKPVTMEELLVSSLAQLAQFSASQLNCPQPAVGGSYDP
jgi:hypothetical protein